jgi:hypothetical protein
LLTKEFIDTAKPLLDDLAPMLNAYLKSIGPPASKKSPPPENTDK